MAPKKLVEQKFVLKLRHLLFDAQTVVYPFPFEATIIYCQRKGVSEEGFANRQSLWFVLSFSEIVF
jgi:hypothetical protein